MGKMESVALLLAFPVCAMGQWAVGPSLNAIGLPPNMPGVGASATYSMNKKSERTFNLAWFIPTRREESGIHVGDPKQLPTSDTSSFSWKGSSSNEAMTGAFDIQRTFNRRPKAHEWFWSGSAGYGIYREHSIEDDVGTFSGATHHYDQVYRSPFLLARLGGGSTWHTHSADLSAGLDYMGAYVFGSAQYHDPGYWEHTLALMVSYRWRV